MGASQLLRRVDLHLNIWLHGLGVTPAESHAEALGRVEDAVVMLGGLINLHGVTSEIGRFTVPLGAERPHAGEGNRGG